MLNKNKKAEIFDSCLESKTDEVESTSEQLEKSITFQNISRRPNVSNVSDGQINSPNDQRNPSDGQINSSKIPRSSFEGTVNSSEGPVLTSVSDEVSGDQPTKRLKVIGELNTDDVDIEKDTKKSFVNQNDLFKGGKTQMINSSNDQRNSSDGPGNPSDGQRNSPNSPVLLSVSVDVSDGQVTKRLNAIEELITKNDKSVNDRLGRLEIEVGIIACMLLLILIILLVFIVGVLTILL